MSKRVLVAEDDEATRAMMAALLGDEGYAVRAAAGGAEGLEELRVWRPDAIVLDAVMPGVDATVGRAVQLGLPDAADVPVLLTSATRATDLDALARDLGGPRRSPSRSTPTRSWPRSPSWWAAEAAAPDGLRATSRLRAGALLARCWRAAGAQVADLS